MLNPARVLEEALELEPQDRARVAHELIASLDGPKDADAEVLWRDEIRRRIDAVESGAEPLEDWASVRDKARISLAKP